MSDTKKHKINSKFRIGLIGIGEVPNSVIKFWNRKNYDKGEFLALRAKKKEQIIDREFNNELINLKIMNTEKMTLDEKREALYDWIRNLDEDALNELINECLNDE